MFYNYFKIALKNLLRHRIVSLINLLGLSTGFAVFGLIVLFLLHERSFDRFHTRFERLCRLNTTMRYPGASPSSIAYASAPMGPFLKETFNRDVEDYCRLVYLDKEFVLQHGVYSVTSGNTFAVDTNFFRVFDFPLLHGDATTAFAKTNNVVLTRKLAEQLFGTTDALGGIVTKTFVSALTQHDSTAIYEVSGVVENPPANSHLQFDALFSPAEQPYWAVWNPSATNDWHSLSTITYLTLRSPQTDLAAVEKQIPEQLKTRMRGSENVSHHLQPMSDIHLGSKYLSADPVTNFGQFDLQYLYIFGAIGLFVLLIACVNYSNLSTVLAGRRAKEIAVRKAVGANRTAVIRQFLGEAVLTSGIALLLSLGIMTGSKPVLESLDYPMEAFSRMQTPLFWAGAAALALLLGIVAGAYPAFFVERFAPARVLRGNQTDSGKKPAFVPVLVTLQFAIAVVLIAGTLVVYRQLQFLQKTDLGYQPSQILIVDMGMANMMKSKTLKSEIKKVPGVEGVALSDQTLGKGLMPNGVLFAVDGKKEHFSLPRISVDEDFMSLYDMKMAAGRAFGEGTATDNSQYIINETLARKLGHPDDAVGIPVTFAESPETGTVVGVVRDFHFNTLHHRVEPMVMRATEWTTALSVKVAPADLPNTLHRLEEAWKSVITDKPFDYRFMDDQFAQTYAAEQRLSRLAGLGAGLTILIACLGLFALAMFTAQARTREIGIRKVLGATVAGIAVSLAGDFLKLVLLAILIASPLAWYGMNRWLEDFAYRIDIQWWMLATAGIAAGAVALLTVGFQSLRAALANPVKSLRSE